MITHRWWQYVWRKDLPNRGLLVTLQKLNKSAVDLNADGANTKLEVDHRISIEARDKVSNLIYRTKTSFHSAWNQDLGGSQKALSKEMNHLHKPLGTPLLAHDSPIIHANKTFFPKKLYLKSGMSSALAHRSSLPAYEIYSSPVSDNNEFSKVGLRL